jgi:hypothetical protein
MFWYGPCVQQHTAQRQGSPDGNQRDPERKHVTACASPRLSRIVSLCIAVQLAFAPSIRLDAHSPPPLALNPPRSY